MLANSISEGDSDESQLQDDNFHILKQLAQVHGGMADEYLDNGVAVINMSLPF